ncbi:MAG: 4-alpha-glucanotransferase [Erysipelotrichaceae bacterium]|jgi:4-alpha-glucanotransferase|nr:4-alpha-glucanotransferase [Erysipelotrichaceae bacterium]
MANQFLRKAGVLMPIASLPGRHGIGDFGSSQYTFLKLLKENKITYLQILPLNRLSYGNSPYQPLSSKALDEIYISLDDLTKNGYLKAVPDFLKVSKRINYDRVRNYKTKYLKEAFHHRQKHKEKDFDGFISENPWVKQYAFFIANKVLNELKPFNEWDKTYELNDPDFKKEYEFQIWLQYIAFKQWKLFFKAAHECGLIIIGDVPFYVGYDSEDVYFNHEAFLLDSQLVPTVVAGVPPDYFNADGQLWGNPIYNWNYLQEHNFSFFIDRLGFTANFFDVIRIDHFRAIDEYYVIDYGEPTARRGHWAPGPKDALVETIKKQYPKMAIIAEDLGTNMETVYQLRDRHNLTGMDVFQFTVFDKSFVHKDNMVIYTGTHDNTTLKSWYLEFGPIARMKLNRLVKSNNIKEKTIYDALIHLTLKAPDSLAIIPIPDLLHLGVQARINTPGLVNDENWSWRLTSYNDLIKKIPVFKHIIEATSRD